MSCFDARRDNIVVGCSAPHPGFNFIEHPGVFIINLYIDVSRHDHYSVIISTFIWKRDTLFKGCITMVRKLFSARISPKWFNWMIKNMREGEGKGKFIERVFAAYRASYGVRAFAELGEELEETKKRLDKIYDDVLPVFKALKRRSQVYGSIGEFRKIILLYRERFGKIAEDTMFP